MSDPDFSKVACLLPLTDDLLDHSLNGIEVTVSGGAELNSDHPHFGTKSLYLPSTDGTLSIANHSKLNPQADSFTLEFFLYHTGNLNAVLGMKGRTIKPSYGIEAIHDFNPIIGEMISILVVYFNYKVVTTVPLPPPNQFTHIALVKEGTDGWIAVDGVVKKVSAPAAVFTNSYPLWFQNYSGSVYIDSVRFTNGEALYTEDFTPPSAPPTVDPDKRLAPNVVGLPKQSAVDTIESRDLVVAYAPPEYDTTVAANHVISQAPQAGTEVEIGDTIALTLSLGVVKATMPDLSGLTRLQAEATLVDAGIPTDIHVYTKDYTGSAALGYVANQTPPAGSDVLITPASSFVVVAISTTSVGVGPFFIASEYDEATAQIVANSYLLGVPSPTVAPTPDAVFTGEFTLVPRTTVDWEHHWQWYWEEADGTRADVNEGDESDLGITVVDAGREYTFTVPARITATPTAKFILWAELYKDDQVLGVVIPAPSQFTDNSTASVYGAAVTGFIDGDNITESEECRLTFDYAITGQEYNSSRQYAVTYVNKFGDEGKPSVITVDGTGRPQNITVHPYQQVLLTYNSAYIPFDYAIDKVRIYRTVTDYQGTTFRFVAEVDVDSIGINQTLLFDDLYDDATREGISTSKFDMPPKELKGIVSMPGGFAAGFHENTVYFSEPYQLHAWPEEYSIGVDATIVGLGVVGNSLIILTERTPYYASGVSPDAILVRKIDATLPCINYESIITVSDRVYFNSLDGIAFVGESGHGYLTENSLSRKIWKDYRGLRPYGFEYNGYLVYSFTDEVIPDNLVTVPDFTGLRINPDPNNDDKIEVEELAASVGLVIGTLTAQIHYPCSANIVLSQSIPVGTLVPHGTIIDLVFCVGAP